MRSLFGDAGDSWARTGKKRNVPRRFSASDRRIDFLKQILRDMLDEQGNNFTIDVKTFLVKF